VRGASLLEPPSRRLQLQRLHALTAREPLEFQSELGGEMPRAPPVRGAPAKGVATGGKGSTLFGLG
jgi:hypothetical protein